MRYALALLMSGLPTGYALAHTLDADAGLGAQLAHQLAGAHHLPLLVLLVAIAVVAIGAVRYRRVTRGNRRT